MDKKNATCRGNEKIMQQGFTEDDVLTHLREVLKHGFGTIIIDIERHGVHDLNVNKSYKWIKK